MKKYFCVVLIGFIFNAVVWSQQSAGVGFADKPAVLTAIGQSADVEMVKVLLTREKIPFRADKSDALFKATDLTSADKTLIIVIGSSSKGLGAAGISFDDEMSRSQALVKRAKDLGMKIIALHVGGAVRRGANSDKLINFAVPVADYVIVVSDSDNDGLFTNLAKEKKVPMSKVDKISLVGAPLAAAFK